MRRREPALAIVGIGPRARNLVFTGFGMNVYEMTADRNGDLLLGGDNWGVGQAVKRLAIPTLKLTTVAGAADGISGRVEGISQSPDGSLFALTSAGIIHRIHEGPLSVTTHFADATNKITTGKDLGLARDGALYIANRGGWGWGTSIGSTRRGRSPSR